MPDEINSKKICSNCNKEFLVLAAEKVFYQKKDLPEPEFCPKCRHHRRLSMRNENTLYKRSCDKCHKNTLSTYRPDSPYIVYCKECYWDSLI